MALDHITLVCNQHTHETNQLCWLDGSIGIQKPTKEVLLIVRGSSAAQAKLQYAGLLAQT